MLDYANFCKKVLKFICIIYNLYKIIKKINVVIDFLNFEGWMHHTVRTAVAFFLTQGDLWLSWTDGHEHFMTHLVDGDLPISAGNWMWLSSSAFDRKLGCALCIDPVFFGKRLESSGDYIRRFVPELTNFEFEYIHEPWKAPMEVQRAANCLIGIIISLTILKMQLMA